MTITKSMVKYLCETAKIEFEEEEFDNIVKDLQDVVNSFDLLNEIENIDSIKSNKIKLNAETDLREDTSKEGLELNMVVKNAPESCGGAIVVPAMVD